MVVGLASMLIHILRHGIAEQAAGGMKDADRALTEDGAKKLRAVLRLARKAGVSPAVILTSPYRRALQTAELAAQLLEHEGEVIRTKALAPGSRPEDVWEEIRLHRQAGEVLVSGHEPLLGQALSYILGAPSLQVDFKKGAIACVQVDHFNARPRGVLRWMITPRLAG
jgi:phosphohistidine phosphatase